MSQTTKLRLCHIALTVLMISALGCQKTECATDADCPDFFTCVGSTVCPEGVVCDWEGEPGLCLLTHERLLCERTGGAWDEGSCGHYECGEFPECDAVIPGCDCGPKANYIEGEGCVEDVTCPGSCESDEDCLEGESCLHQKAPPSNLRPFKPIGLSWNHQQLIVSVSDPGTCVPSDFLLCNATGGCWEEEGCGHTNCQEDSQCPVATPGCNCGDEDSWIDAVGCQLDRACSRISIWPPPELIAKPVIGPPPDGIGIDPGDPRFRRCDEGLFD